MKTFQQFLVEGMDDNLSNASCTIAGKHACEPGFDLTIHDDFSASVYLDYDTWCDAKSEIRTLLKGENDAFFTELESGVPEGYCIDQSRREKTFSVKYDVHGAMITFHIVECE